MAPEVLTIRRGSIRISAELWANLIEVLRRSSHFNSSTGHIRRFPKSYLAKHGHHPTSFVDAQLNASLHDKIIYILNPNRNNLRAANIQRALCGSHIQILQERRECVLVSHLIFI
jgi:hypothetical protein